MLDLPLQGTVVLVEDIESNPRTVHLDRGSIFLS